MYFLKFQATFFCLPVWFPVLVTSVQNMTLLLNSWTWLWKINTKETTIHSDLSFNKLNHDLEKQNLKYDRTKEWQQKMVQPKPWLSGIKWRNQLYYFKTNPVCSLCSGGKATTETEQENLGTKMIEEQNQ